MKAYILALAILLALGGAFVVTSLMEPATAGENVTDRSADLASGQRPQSNLPLASLGNGRPQEVMTARSRRGCFVRSLSLRVGTKAARRRAYTGYDEVGQYLAA